MTRAATTPRCLEPARDHQQIVHGLACYDFPFDMTRALEFALFRTFCAPRVSALLDATREFGERAQKRYDDTDLLISQFVEHGYDSARGRAAIARMNAIHTRFRIANEDFLYVLSTFVFEPIRWIARYGHRALTEHERLGLYHFWREVGTRMGIRDIPASYEDFERYNLDYERAHFRYTDANRRVGTATREMFCARFPRPLRPLVRAAIHALLDTRLLDAFGFPPAPRALRAAVHGGLRLRARLARLVPRTRPRLRTALRHRSYPRGYVIEELGATSRRD